MSTKRLAVREDLDDDEARQLRESLLRLANDLVQTSDAKSECDRITVLQKLLGEDVCRRIGIYRLPEGFRLSVIIPAYNELATIERVIERVRNCGLPCEIVVVDDGSQDGTRELLKTMENQNGLKVIFHPGNRGKGAALKTGFSHASGDVIVIQDADLEYDPRDFRLLLQPIVEGRADVVYGSRFSRSEQRGSPWWHRTVNKMITMLSNLRTGRPVTDAETCYKMFRRELLDQIGELQEKAFGIELELTAKFARIPGVRYHERPIGYERRSYAEGKKIGVKDGFRALWCILRY
ncbi:MAG: Undecaprenyl-phosphate 4-deoxy-4-formamido-L-arabinose transferase [Planctomycetota bacterium]